MTGGLCAEATPFQEALDREGNFRIRRAAERLREGLFDPVAVRLLTAHEERLHGEVARSFNALDAGGSTHLGIVGAYGQGKSHSLFYIQDLALREGFATSLISLDPREVPFTDFRTVYRELVSHLQLPDGGSFPGQWKAWAQQQLKAESAAEESILPPQMPHLFRATLTAMAHANVSLSEKEKRKKKHAAFRPREFPLLLNRALAGDAIPTAYLKAVFTYRDVPFFKDAPLKLRGTEPYLAMLPSLARLLKQMGYRGWVILFDEGESIAQLRVTARAKSYALLQRLLFPESAAPLFPVFAFTEDFFDRVQQEDFDRARMRGDTAIPTFERNYAREWEQLRLYRLHDLSPMEWQELAHKLICLHAKAYRWQPEEAPLAREMATRLEAMRGQETRLKLKALVHCLDLAQQS